MMNSAHLHVAMRVIGLLEAAWQKVDAYAQERRQMRAPGRKSAPAHALERWFMPELSMRLGIIDAASFCMPASV